MGCTIDVVLANFSDNGQIDAYNLRGPTERDLPYIA